jgi:ComF family protein
MPVPLSPKRKGERGFNQAEVIGRFLSGKIGIRLDTFSLVRSKHTPMHRAGMDRKARDLTVKNAFEVFRPNLVKGQSVVLVDDIFTTGATASYCAKELKKKGAVSVRVVTLARAVRNLP